MSIHVSGTRRILVRWSPTALLAFAIFSLDTIITVDVVVPVLYVNVILLVMRSGRPNDVFVAGWSSIMLAVFSFLITVDLRHIPTTALLSNALSLLVIFCVMTLCVRNIRFQSEVVRARDRTERVSRRVALEALSASIVHDITKPLSGDGNERQCRSSLARPYPAESRRSDRGDPACRRRCLEFSPA